MNDLYDGMGLTCTGNDLQVKEFVIMGNAVAYCVKGENVTAHLSVILMSTATIRYDIGIVVALDGGTASNGTCMNSNLHPVSLDVNVTSGVGPFYNGESGTPDVCGDVRSSDGDTTVDLGQVTFLCEDRDGNGVADVAGGVAWDNQPSDGSLQRPYCLGPDDIGPNTKSKCHFDVKNIHLMSSTSVASAAAPSTSTSPSTSTDSTTTTTTTPPEIHAFAVLSTTTSSVSTTTPEITTNSYTWIIFPIVLGPIVVLILLVACCRPIGVDPRLKRKKYRV